jgi:hypothetical protein
MPLKAFAATGACRYRPIVSFRTGTRLLSACGPLPGIYDREARLGVLRGLLALESGQVAPAREQFRKSLVFLKSAAGAPFASQRETTGARLAAEYFLRRAVAEDNS